MVLVSLGVVAGLGMAGGYGLSKVVDAVRAAWPGGGPELLSAKEAPPEPIDMTGPADTCLPESLDVRLAADVRSITAGDPVTFSVRVANVGLAPCLVDGSEVSRRVTITDASGKDRVWSSGDCAEGERMLLLGPGDEWAQDVRWSFVRTVEGCKGGQPAVEPGDYRATVTLDDVPGARSNNVTVTVAPAPEPTQEPSPSSEPSHGATPEPSQSAQTEPSGQPSGDPSDAPADGDANRDGEDAQEAVGADGE